jgi:hypothetical protein
MKSIKLEYNSVFEKYHEIHSESSVRVKVERMVLCYVRKILKDKSTQIVSCPLSSRSFYSPSFFNDVKKEVVKAGLRCGVEAKVVETGKNYYFTVTRDASYVFLGNDSIAYASLDD